MHARVCVCSRVLLPSSHSFQISFRRVAGFLLFRSALYRDSCSCWVCHTAFLTAAPQKKNSEKADLQALRWNPTLTSIYSISCEQGAVVAPKCPQLCLPPYRVNERTCAHVFSIVDTVVRKRLRRPPPLPPSASLLVCPECTSCITGRSEGDAREGNQRARGSRLLRRETAGAEPEGTVHEQQQQRIIPRRWRSRRRRFPRRRHGRRGRIWRQTNGRRVRGQI